ASHSPNSPACHRLSFFALHTGRLREVVPSVDLPIREAPLVSTHLLRGTRRANPSQIPSRRHQLPFQESHWLQARVRMLALPPKSLCRLAQVFLRSRCLDLEVVGAPIELGSHLDDRRSD